MKIISEKSYFWFGPFLGYDTLSDEGVNEKHEVILVFGGGWVKWWPPNWLLFLLKAIGLLKTA